MLFVNEESEAVFGSSNNVAAIARVKEGIAQMAMAKDALQLVERYQSAMGSLNSAFSPSIDMDPDHQDEVEARERLRGLIVKFFGRCTIEMGIRGRVVEQVKALKAAEKTGNEPMMN